MDQVFNAMFIATCVLIAGASLILTEKFKDLFKTTEKGVKYVISFIATLIVSLSVKYLGAIATWNLLTLLGGGKLPDVPKIPDMQLGWGYWIFMFILSWLMASGLYDYLKPLFKNKPKE